MSPHKTIWYKLNLTKALVMGLRILLGLICSMETVVPEFRLDVLLIILNGVDNSLGYGHNYNS